MYNYSNVPNIFTYTDIITDSISRAGRNHKEYYLKRGSFVNMPIAIKALQHYCLLKDIALFMPSIERVTRSTDLTYYFHNLERKTDVVNENNQHYNSPLGLSLEAINSFNFKDLFAVHIVPVVGQIQDVFETRIPAWASRCEATEQLGVSLALKVTPKHRVRVYTRGQHIILFTTKGINDEFDEDYKFQRNFWACIPLLRGWVKEGQEPSIDQLIINLYRSLINADATDFWLRLEGAYKQDPDVENLKYNTIIQTFNSINTNRINRISRSINDLRRAAEDYLNQYSAVLTQQQDAERTLIALEQTGTELDIEVIKRLVDKKICYALNTNYINDGNSKLAYRCSAPLLSYDKDAARSFYNRRIKNNGSDKLDKIFKLLFIDEKVVLNFDEAIDVSLSSNSIQAGQNSTRLRNDLHQHFPNPHHFYFNCWGSYGPVIIKLIKEYKLEELFYQVKAAVGSINFTDYPVMSHFVDQLNNLVHNYYNPNCFLWRDENCTTLHNLEETLKHFEERTAE